MSLLVTGTVAFDAIETPFGKTDKIIGGAATYVSLAASYFTGSVGLIAVVGDDFPQTYIDFLKSRGIDTSGLQVKEGEKSFFWSGRYFNDMNSRETLITELNVLADFDPIVPSGLDAPDYLMLGNLAPKVQSTLISRLSKRPKLIAMDTMNFWMDVAMDDLKETLKMVDVLTINDEEARQLSGEYSLIKASRKIREMGPKYLIIKKGEHGALLFYNDKVFFAPAMLLEDVFDPTGAGDTFAGGFIGWLAKTDDISFENMKRAIIYGSALASFCVEKFGTDNIVNIDENLLQERVAAFKELSYVEMLP
ncbi:MAG: bifunctional hydroxymethylpyrimidine kinase/phosphomethylpyrimidine kinase [Bacteroidia bacterium]|nr:bifunctional hydroxymethylpyrimidine kinase/phosphomethylpyrimidine kinase [Bacteroidia bacterium]